MVVVVIVDDDDDDDGHDACTPSLPLSRRGSTVSVAPSTFSLNVGRHIGSDTNITRASEQLGYIVIEAGSGYVDGVAYTAGVGTVSVQGMDDAPPYTYNVSNAGLNLTSGVATLAVSVRRDEVVCSIC